MVESISEELLEKAVEFHGHLGPFLVLGLRAGLVATEVLGKDPFKMYAVVETDDSPPSSCFIDGVQLVSGCTLGKGNLECRESQRVSALFFNREKKLLVKVRNDVLHKVFRKCSKEESEKMAIDLSVKDSDKLFDISIKQD